jgi:hypothetical protein
MLLVRANAIQVLTSEASMKHFLRSGVALFLCILATGASAQTMRPDEAFWNAIRDTGDTKSFQLFADTYPDSPYAADAKKRLAEEADQASPAPEAEAVPVPIQPPTFEQIVTAKDQQLIDLLYQSGMLREGI